MTWACLGAYGVASVVVLSDVGEHGRVQESEGESFDMVVHFGFGQREREHVCVHVMHGMAWFLFI
jgi:hypothetical protein